MGCTPSFPISSMGAFCRGYNNERSPPCSSNHLLLSGGSTSQSTPSRPEREKCDIFTDENLSSYQGELKMGPLKLIRTQVKALIVFPKEDSVCEAWTSCCKKQGHESTVVAGVDDVLKIHLDQCFELVVVDARSHKLLRAEMVAESVRSCEGSSSCIIVAIVKKSSLERDSRRIQFLLNNGFNRIICESSSKSTVMNDLVQIERCDLVLQQQTKVLSALFAALDSCKDIVHITDAHHRIQYINRASENFLGYCLDELSGKTIWEVHGSDYHRPEVRTPTGSDIRSTDSLSHPSSIHRSSIDNRSAEFIKEVRVNLDVSEAVNLQMRRGKDWEGLVTCRRKSGDLINLSSKVVPVVTHSRKNEFFVYVSDSSSHHSDRLELFHHHTRGSIKSLRKGSYDIRSLNSDEVSLEAELHGGVLSAPVERDKFTFNRPPARFDSFRREGSMIRRQSVAKLHSVMMEAPITRVVNLITTAQEGSPPYVAQALDKVLEILRSTELYNPQMMLHDNIPNSKPVPADPVATDLLGALLSHAPKPLSSGRRSSNDQSVKMSSNLRPSLPSFQQASSAIKETLNNDLGWSFDVLKLEMLTDKRPLVWLGMSIMGQLNVPNTIGCDEQTLQNWLTLIEANYQASNSYHNSTHAADVLQTTAFFLQTEKIKKLFDPMDAAACLIAAVVHDVDHPGKNSQFLCNTNNDLAILYNDVCVLESHHAAVSFKLTFSDDRVNILKGLDQESYKFMRKNIVDMVLATDMAKHFEHVNKFINMLEKCIDPDVPSSDGDSVSGTLDFSKINTSENIQVIKRMIIKCADISNPMRPLHLCKDWAIRIANEYFNQTEEEKKRKIPVVMPQFDRTTCSIPKSQIGFIDFFIFDMFDAWNELANIPELMTHLKDNYQYWKEQEEFESADRSKSPLVESPSHRGSHVENIIVEEIS